MQVIIKQSYAHYNRSLGMFIKNKDHYDRVCKEGNYVSYEQCKEIAEKARKEKIKPYKISKDTWDIIRVAKNSMKADGKIKLPDAAIDRLIEKKVIGKKIPSYMKLPSHYDKGGFEK
jgi:hypothetical protein